jgi:diguanylate cyclase (GGDEF)-like protein
MYLFFDTDDMSAPHTDSFPVSDIIPHLDEALDRGYPLIFTALNFIDIPLGYVCFHYRNYGIDNYCKIVQNVNSLNNGIGSFRIMRHQQYMTKQFERIAVIDHLTGLYNRNGSQTAFVKMKSELARDGGTLTFILADLDGLKYINDNFGHTEGDNAITAIANAIKHACPENAICARIGGDEIIAFFDEPCSEQEIRERMKCYIDSLAEKPYEISASLGLCTASGSEIPDFEQLIKASDKLMYNEKRKRKHFRQRYNDE